MLVTLANRNPKALESAGLYLHWRRAGTVGNPAHTSYDHWPNFQPLGNDETNEGEAHETAL